MLSKLTKLIVPATMFAVVALTMNASSPEAFARGGHGGHGHQGHHGHRGHRFGNYRNRGYFGYRNYGLGWYNGYGYPDYSYSLESVPVCETPVCGSTTSVASVYGYPIYGGYSDGFGFGWGRGYRGYFWGNRGSRGRGMRGGHGGHGRR